MKKEILFDSLTIQELEEIICRASAEIETRRLAEASSVREKIKTILDDSGLSLSEVFQDKMLKKGRRKVAIKYENPEDHRQQWSGRGKMPVWLREKVDSGLDRESFRIQE